MKRYPEERLFSLDLLRGLDMMFLTVAALLLWEVNAVWGLPECVRFQLTHPWEGFTCWDIIMPMFIFMCGAAIPFSLERRIEKNGGKAGAAYWKHVLGRFVLLWALGMLVQGHLASLDALEIRPYNNTLQSIASGYLIVACAVLIPSMKTRIAVPVVCFAVYGFLLHFLGDYSMTGNFAGKVEHSVVAAIVPAGSKAIREVGEIVHAECAYIHDLRRNGSDDQWRFALDAPGCGGVHAWTAKDDPKAKELEAKYRHPLWREAGEIAKLAGGHGGKDFMMDLRWAHCLQNGLPLDIDGIHLDKIGLA